MSKHTPGPWQVEFDPTLDGDPLTLIMPEGGEMYEKFIARCEFDPKGDGITDCTPVEAQANARLIAAAPDLLAACKAVLDEGRYVNKVHPEIVSELEAAISKAEA